jgi:putative membrane protein
MRTLPLMLGLITLAAAWTALPVPGSSHAFYVHMAVHMSVVAVAAPLLSFAAAGGRWDPVRRHPAAFSPVLASLLELAVVWIWHTPMLHSAARQSYGALAMEQSSFLAAGVVLWIAVLGGDQRTRAQRSAEGVVALLLTAMHMTLLGALLALSPRPLYDHMHGASGLTALEDLHLGGAIMLVAGGASYLAGGLWLSFSLLRTSRELSAQRVQESHDVTPVLFGDT